MTISNEPLDELLKGCKRPDDLLGEAGLMKELKIRLMERMLGAELTVHLGYEAGAEPPPDQTNRRSAQACSSQTANEVCSGWLIEHRLFPTFTRMKYVKVRKI